MRQRLTFGVAATLVVCLTALQGVASEGYAPECGPPQPEEVRPVELVAPAPGVARIVWPSQMGYWTDIVRGTLKTLLATKGDYVESTERCLMDDTGGTSYDDPDLPPDGDGFWYLLRPDQRGGCLYGAGGYNSEEGYQVGFTNLEIQESKRDCTCYLICTREP